MNKATKSSTLCQILLNMMLLFMFESCSGQDNPPYIGAEYGTFDLDKITFSERLDTLFSKTEKYYKMPKGDEVFDEKSGKYLIRDTLYHMYRTPTKYVAEGTFRFKSLLIKPKEVVDFYTDHLHNFRKVEVSVYLNNTQYAELRAACKDFRDVTPANVRKVNNGKYVILQSEEAGKQIRTTLYCLENTGDTRGDNEQKFFIRISKTSLAIRNDKFYLQLKDDIK